MKTVSIQNVFEILNGFKANGIENILALRGDISPDITPCGDFRHANELIEFICERGYFNIIAACYPEGHSESKNLKEDIRYTKQKVDSGASHLITQLFLDNSHFYSFRGYYVFHLLECHKVSSFGFLFYYGRL
ncbi:MAG: methylenetetrahydrofolate reductase [Oscillospiraceae bacterium]